MIENTFGGIDKSIGNRNLRDNEASAGDTLIDSWTAVLLYEYNKSGRWSDQLVWLSDA